MARAPVSKTDCFANNFKAHSEKLSFSTSHSINRLASNSECPALSRLCTRAKQRARTMSPPPGNRSCGFPGFSD
jgi:hypothetical protein